MKILFIDTLNTCRSPMAENIFRKLVKDDNLVDKIMCQSAGTGANTGDVPEEKAVECMKSWYLNLSSHRSRRFRAEEIPIWDGFFTMSKTHAYILEQLGVPTDKIYISKYIDDPSGKSLEEYENCRNLLAKEVMVFYARLKMVYEHRDYEI
ncbi:MAG: hypothetical protein R3Y35_02940 [Clostridia bacterium]